MPAVPAVQFPERLETERLWLRAPQVDAAAEMRAAVVESFDELHRWMDWAREVPSLEVEREIMRASRERHQRREEATWLMWRKSDGQLVGAGGLPRLSWDRRCFEIGYWARISLVGNGYVTEFVKAVAGLCFGRFEARRVELRMSSTNQRSRRVAELARFRFERTIVRDGHDPNGTLRDTVVYAVYAPEEVAP